MNDILSVYGISQNPDTKDFIIVLDMGLYDKESNTTEIEIYRATPYMPPEVLRGKPYTHASHIFLRF
ncbi:kinase-like domain-containing protein [Rhizophagus clarus]|uniref:Kinase-like domain-containing protein n=1 Tax=Rhizophagus clarus TaxID=94130 RepID=A0A8H3LPR4_9GLOM|nr:kinase-like domain-containing protein [Rhizophagus clarus]